jgi:hypothetical protein
MFSKLLCASVVAVALAQEMSGALVCDGAGDFRARSDIHCTDTIAIYHSQTTAGTFPFGSVVLNSEARGHLCATESVGTGIEIWDGSVVFLAKNEGAFVREATSISSDTELSGINVARALPHYVLSFARDCFTIGVGGTFSRSQKGITSNCSYLAAGKTHSMPFRLYHFFFRMENRAAIHPRNTLRSCCCCGIG